MKRPKPHKNGRGKVQIDKRGWRRIRLEYDGNWNNRSVAKMAWFFFVILAYIVGHWDIVNIRGLI